MAFTLETREEMDVLILFAKGNLIESIDGDLLVNILDDHSERLKILVNCESIKHLNSTGINSFLKIFTITRNRGGELVLCALPTSVEKLLIITKLNSIFTIFPDIDAALGYFKTLKS